MFYNILLNRVIIYAETEYISRLNRLVYEIEDGNRVCTL